MDWADDIAYSIHDTEDFYRAGLIPLDRFATNTDAVDNFLATTFERWEHEKIEMRFARTDLEQSFRELCEALPITEPYTGTNSQRAALRTVTSNFIGRYVRSTRIGEALQNESLLAREDEHQMQIIMLKELTWQFVINSSALASQQCGQQKAISTLFRIFMDTVTTNNPARWARLPARNREDMEKLYEHYGMGIPESERIRVVADAIAGMTDQQAMLMYHRLMGITSGSSFDAVIL